MSIQKRARLVPWVAVFALMALVVVGTVPSLAATSTQKLAQLNVRGPGQTMNATNSTVGVGTGQTFQVDMTNKSPGNSNFNTATVTTPLCAPATSGTCPTQNFFITSATMSAGPVGNKWTVTWKNENG